jgi:hypothetical protein
MPFGTSQMEVSMCYEIDYMFFAEQKKAQEAQKKQEQRAGVINKLLTGATPAKPAKVGSEPIKEVAPAK